MLTPDEARDRSRNLIDRALRAGADAGDAAYLSSVSESVQVRLGKLEDVERSEGEHISLRVFVGSRSASIGSSDLSDAALTELAQRAVAMAREAPEDRWAGLAPEEMLLRGPLPDLELVDPVAKSPADLRAAAEEAEDAAMAIAGVTNSEGGAASAGGGVFALSTSHGFDGAYASTSHGLGATVVAGTGAGKQRDYSWRQARFGADLPDAADVGRRAGERAVARLDPGRVRSGKMPLVFDPRVGGSLVGHLFGAIAGPAIARRSSFLLDRAGERLFDSSVVLCEEPHRKRGLRSRPFDGEGLPTAARRIIDDGRLAGWLMESASARQLGLQPTGHASRGHGAPGVSASNVHLMPGSQTAEELMADIADGIYVHELFGNGVNGVTGDYSRGASGYRIVNGAIAGPVAEFTIAGNLIDMFAALVAANDLEFYRAINVPTLRIDGMTVAGD